MRGRNLILRLFFTGLFVASLGIGVGALLESSARFSIAGLGTLVGLFFPPQFVSIQVLLGAVAETLLIGLTGTFLGFSAALVFSLFAAWLGRLPRMLVSVPAWFARGIPDVVFAVLLSQVFGFGPLTGALALMLGTFGVSSKLILISLMTRESEVDKEFLASGMGRVWLTLSVIFPQTFRDLVSQFFLRLEVNFRIAVVLGLVGGGGLGLLLSQSLGLLDYARAAGTVLAIVGFVFLTETFSSRLRERWLKSDRSVLSSWIFTLAPILLTATSTAFIWANLAMGNQRFSLAQLERLALSALSPDFVSQLEPLASGLLQSLGLAAVATTLAFPLAIALALISSRRATQSRRISNWSRVVLGTLRSFPIAVLALVLVIPFGLGAQTALIALVLGGSLFIARILADYIEDSSDGPVATFSRSGAGFLTRSNVLLVSNLQKLRRSWFFTLDFLFRYTVILGILGAGGLGQVILSAIRVQDMQTVAAAVLLIVSVVGLIEIFEASLESRAKSQTWKKVGS